MADSFEASGHSGLAKVIRPDAIATAPVTKTRGVQGNCVHLPPLAKWVHTAFRKDCEKGGFIFYDSGDQKGFVSDPDDDDVDDCRPVPVAIHEPNQASVDLAVNAQTAVNSGNINAAPRVSDTRAGVTRAQDGWSEPIAPVPVPMPESSAGGHRPTESCAAPVVVVDVTGSPPPQATSDTMGSASPNARSRTQFAAARASTHTRAEAQAQSREPGATAGGEPPSRQGKRKAGSTRRAGGATQVDGGTAAAEVSLDGKRPASNQSVRNGKRKATCAVASNEPSRSKRRVDGAAVVPGVASTASALIGGGVVTRSASASRKANAGANAHAHAQSSNVDGTAIQSTSTDQASTPRASSSARAPSSTPRPAAPPSDPRAYAMVEGLEGTERRVSLMRRRGVHCHVIGDKLAYCLMYIEERRRPKIKPLSDEAIHWPQFTAAKISAWRHRLSTLHLKTDLNEFVEAFRQTRVEGVHWDGNGGLRASHALGVLGLLYNLKFNIVCVNLGSRDWVDLYRTYTPTRSPNSAVRTAYLLYNGYWYDVLAGARDEERKEGDDRLIFSYSAEDMRKYGDALDNMAMAEGRRFFSASMQTKVYRETLIGGDVRERPYASCCMDAQYRCARGKVNDTGAPERYIPFTNIPYPPHVRVPTWPDNVRAMWVESDSEGGSCDEPEDDMGGNNDDGSSSDTGGESSGHSNRDSVGGNEGLPREGDRALDGSGSGSEPDNRANDGCVRAADDVADDLSDGATGLPRDSRTGAPDDNAGNDASGARATNDDGRAEGEEVRASNEVERAAGLDGDDGRAEGEVVRASGEGECAAGLGSDGGRAEGEGARASNEGECAAGLGGDDGRAEGEGVRASIEGECAAGLGGRNGDEAEGAATDGAATASGDGANVGATQERTVPHVGCGLNDGDGAFPGITDGDSDAMRADQGDASGEVPTSGAGEAEVPGLAALNQLIAALNRAPSGATPTVISWVTELARSQQRHARLRAPPHESAAGVVTLPDKGGAGASDGD